MQQNGQLLFKKWAAAGENQQTAYAKTKAQTSSVVTNSWSAPLFSQHS